MIKFKFLDIPGFRSGTNPPEEFMHINFYDGGLGDHIARLPAVKYMVENYPFVNLTVWCPKFFVEFGKKAVPQVSWNAYQNTRALSMSRHPLNAGSIDGVTSLRTHLVDHAFMRIVDRQVDIQWKNYIQVDSKEEDLSTFDLPEKYVIITTGYTVAVRELKASIVNEVIDYVISKGYTPVFLGKDEATVGAGVQNIKGNFSKDINYSKGLDLRNKTTLLQSHAIIARSKTIIGLDNGLLHLAGCTDIPIVAGFTTVDPKFRVPYRNDTLGWNVFTVTPPESLECRFCQSNMNFVYDFDFRNCFYKDLKCIKDSTSASYIEHLKNIL